MPKASQRAEEQGEPAARPGAWLVRDSDGLAEVLGRQGIGLCLVGQSFRVLWSNRHHVETHAWGSEAGGHCYRELLGAEAPCAGCIVKEVLRAGSEVSIERLAPKGEGTVSLHLAASPVFGGSQGLECVLLTTVENERTEQPMGRDEAEKLASLGVLAAGVVHELNNIIGGMSGHAELARLYPDREELAKHALDVVTQNSSRARVILKQLVDYSREPTGDIASFSVVDVLEQILELVSRNLDMAEVRVVRRYDKDVTVTANPWRLRLALLNLMLDATDRVRRRSELVVEVSRCRGEASCARKSDACAAHGCVRLKLRYAAQPAADASKAPAARCAFDRSMTRSVRTWDPWEAALSAFAEMNAEVRTTENEATGRTVEAAVPLERGADGPAAIEPGPRPEAKRRALVVDDEEVIRELVKAVLTDEGYEVTLAASGRSGVELARSQGFDVALVDLMMPGEMGGFATLREIKGLRPECRVVLMTGRPPDEELESQLRLADAHVLKPFHCSELVECIRRVAV